MRSVVARPVSFIVPLAILAVAAFWISYSIQVASADEHLIVVRNGDGEPGYSVNAYLPQEITIRTGTTVRWDYPFPEPHSVTYGDPGPETPSGTEWDGTTPVNSGVMSVIFGSDPSWELTFTAEGEYEFYCIIHPFQTMTVTVVDDGPVDSQADVDARAEAYYQDALARVKAVGADLQAAPVQYESLDDGTTRWTVINGGHTDDGHDAFIYAPDPITVTEGDTIRWVNEIPVPHTVSFGPPPDFQDPWAVEPSVPAEAFDGEGFWHSGTMFGVPDAIPNTIQEFELIFPNAGTYDYYCLFHAPMGHAGKVVVQEADADPVDDEQPDPPATGSGFVSGGAPVLPLTLGALALVLAFALLGARAARTGARNQG